MKKNTIYKIVLIALFMLFAIWKFLSTTSDADKLYEKLSIEYDALTLESEINNIVVKTYYPSSWRGSEFFQYITFDNGKKYHIKIDRCISTRDLNFGDIVNRGSLITKKYGTDTLILLVNREEYRFIINQEK